jgi:ethanolamine utilization protein EutP
MMHHRVTFNDMVGTAQPTPWRFMVFGGVGAGKTTLIKVLEHKNPELTSKTQMIDYAGWGIDTPGEFTESGHMRRTLVSVSFDAQVLLAVQDATRKDSPFPPNYFLMFPQPIIGVITKMDQSDADAERAAKQLARAGVTGEIVHVSAFTGFGISQLREILLNGNF